MPTGGGNRMRHLILPSLVLAALTGSQCRAQQGPVGPDGPPGYQPVDNSPSAIRLKDYNRYGRTPQGAALTPGVDRVPWPTGPDGPFPRIHPGQTELPPG